jgi:hypothetical protein
MTERARLPQRRASLSWDLECNGQHYTATVSRFRDGVPAEIFLTNGKVGSDADAACRDCAVLASLALQHGVPIDTLRKSLLRDGRGNPSTPIGVALDRLAEGGEL